jgi:uncharacterized protein
MVCFVVVLFFSITGLTLNHPTWTLGGEGSRARLEGTLPANFKSDDGTIDWLTVAEYFRSTHGARGAVADRRSDDSQGTISFKGPGYGADAFFDVDTGTYEMNVESQGPLGVANDLHKGRDSNSSWKWLIDVSAVLLILISATGLGLQLFLRKRRRSGVAAAVIGALIVALLTWFALQ